MFGQIHKPYAALVCGLTVLCAPAVDAALTGHFVASDWSGNTADAWVNRVGTYNDATVHNGTPVFDGDFIDFGGNSSFNIGANPNSPTTGLLDFVMTVVFRSNGTQINGGDTLWWQQAGLFGAEIPGQAHADVGLTLDANGAMLFGMGDTRDYDRAQGGSILDTNVHVASILRDVNGTTVTLELWIDGVKVDFITMNNPTAGDSEYTLNPIEDSAFAIGAQLYNSAIGDYHAFNGDIAELQINDDASIDIAALHTSLVQNGNYIPEPGSLSLLGLGGLCMLKRRRRGQTSLNS